MIYIWFAPNIPRQIKLTIFISKSAENRKKISKKKKKKKMQEKNYLNKNIIFVSLSGLVCVGNNQSKVYEEVIFFCFALLSMQ